MRTTQRHIGLVGATSIGVGAIVGGGILALAGTSFAAAGPAAILAFALNGIIAMVTAFSFAELASSNPKSGGTYSFAKSTLTVDAAFGVGWVVWFASIVAAGLYALGFGAFAVESLRSAWAGAPPIFSDPRAPVVVAIVTVGICVQMLRRSPDSGGNLVNILKLAVFAIIILGGAAVWLRTSPPAAERIIPFMPGGWASLLAAMGFTFIAFQGFDLIAAVAGEVSEPERNIPRSMILSLIVAIIIYIPLLLIVMVLGVPAGGDIKSLATEYPDTIVAVAARNFLGGFGYWMVMVSGVLAMFSALLANLFAASRIARVMAGDRNLPRFLSELNDRRGTPQRALEITGLLTATALLAMGDVARAGAASSLIFLISFALTHYMCILARQRRPDHNGFRTPGWPYVPAAGLLICAGLAVFQGIVVPSAGSIVALWLLFGFLIYLRVFGKRARTLDAVTEYSNSEVMQLRGRSPLVLVPIANPANAEALATLGICFTPAAGRLMMLNVIPPAASKMTNGGEKGVTQNRLDAMIEVLKGSMRTEREEEVRRLEVLIAVSSDPWAEMVRVSRAHQCAMTLIGMANLGDEEAHRRIETLMTDLPGDIGIVRAPAGWNPGELRRIIVPLGGRVVHNVMRARLLSALSQSIGTDELLIEYLIVVPTAATQAEQNRLSRIWTNLVQDESTIAATVKVIPHDNVVEAVTEAATGGDLLVLGVGQVGRRRVLGNITRQLAERGPCATIIIGQRD